MIWCSPLLWKYQQVSKANNPHGKHCQCNACYPGLRYYSLLMTSTPWHGGGGGHVREEKARQLSAWVNAEVEKKKAHTLTLNALLWSDTQTKLTPDCQTSEKRKTDVQTTNWIQFQWETNQGWCVRTFQTCILMDPVEDPMLCCKLGYWTSLPTAP